jgi:RimJ/RimL family protein N-acetyltransferase
VTPHLADTPVIRTERLTLRAPRMDDYPAWEEFFTSDRARFVGGPGDVRSSWRAFAHVVGMWALRGFGSFVFTAKGADTPLGMTGPWYPMEWPEREIGWSVWTADAEGKGLAAEAALAARAYAYRDLGWQTAVSYIDPENARSIALARRLGCTPEADAAVPEATAPLVTWRHPAPGRLQ